MKRRSPEKRLTRPVGPEGDNTKRILGRAGALFGIAAMSFASYQLIVGGVKAARENHILQDLPQWANPLEHVNNGAVTLAADSMLFTVTAVGLTLAERVATPRCTRAFAKTLFATGVVLNGLGEMNATQPLIDETHIFTSSNPDTVDFVYGAAASVLFAGGFSKVLDGRFGEASEAKYGAPPHKNSHSGAQALPAGPADFVIVQQPQSFQTIHVPSEF